MKKIFFLLIIILSATQLVTQELSRVDIPGSQVQDYSMHPEPIITQKMSSSIFIL